MKFKVTLLSMITCISWEYWPDTREIHYKVCWIVK